MPKELNLTPPLVEAQKMIADFLCSVTHAELDLKRLAQLIEVGQQEIERGKKNDTLRYLFWFEDGGKEDWTFEIEATDYLEAYEKAYNTYGPQVENMLYKLI